MIREQVHYLFLWVVSAVMAAFAVRHVEEDKKADDGNEEHSTGNGGNDKHEKTFLLPLAASVGGHKDLVGIRISFESRIQCEASFLKLCAINN